MGFVGGFERDVEKSKAATTESIAALLRGSSASSPLLLLPPPVWGEEPPISLGGSRVAKRLFSFLSWSHKIYGLGHGP